MSNQNFSIGSVISLLMSSIFSSLGMELAVFVCFGILMTCTVLSFRDDIKSNHWRLVVIVFGWVPVVFFTLGYSTIIPCILCPFVLIAAMLLGRDDDDKREHKPRRVAKKELTFIPVANR